MSTFNHLPQNQEKRKWYQLQTLLICSRPFD